MNNELSFCVIFVDPGGPACIDVVFSKLALTLVCSICLPTSPGNFKYFSWPPTTSLRISFCSSPFGILACPNFPECHLLWAITPSVSTPTMISHCTPIDSSTVNIASYKMWPRSIPCVEGLVTTLKSTIEDHVDPGIPRPIRPSEET